MGKGQENGYWDKRVLKDKARDVNNAEKFLQKNQKVLYAQAAEEIQQEIEKLYGKFTDQQDISIAEARRLIRGADFKKDRLAGHDPGSPWSCGKRSGKGRGCCRRK